MTLVHRSPGLLEEEEDGFFPLQCLNVPAAQPDRSPAKIVGPICQMGGLGQRFSAQNKIDFMSVLSTAKRIWSNHLMANGLKEMSFSTGPPDKCLCVFWGWKTLYCRKFSSFYLEHLSFYPAHAKGTVPRQVRLGCEPSQPTRPMTSSSPPPATSFVSSGSCRQIHHHPLVPPAYHRRPSTLQPSSCTRRQLPPTGGPAPPGQRHSCAVSLPQPAELPPPLLPPTSVL